MFTKILNFCLYFFCEAACLILSKNDDEHDAATIPPQRSVGCLLGNTPKRDKCYIVGRGPSLDEINTLDLKDGYVVCINDVYRFVSDADFVFWHDAVFEDQIVEILNKNLTLVLPTKLNNRNGRVCTDSFLGKYKESKRVFYYNKLQLNFFSLFKGHNNLCNTENSLIGLSATVHSAVHFAKKLGCSKVVFVGIDGYSFKGKFYSSHYGPKETNLITRILYRKSRFEVDLLCKFLKMNSSFMIDIMKNKNK
jgi:hypothetical protein